jgi:hypothetical protein
MIEEEIPEATEEFMQYIKRPVTLSSKKAKEFIADLEETIVELRQSLKDKTPLEKNMIYNQIKNRESQINYANTFL